MTYDEAIEAINDAKRTLNKADELVKNLGHLMPGRLKLMSYSTLKKLKKELKNFNMHTGQWNNV